MSVSRRHQRPPDLAQTFDRIADAYEARPGYPTEVFDLLSERCRLGVGARVLEIGPGVGQATIPRLDRGAAVTAVEPGAALARRLHERTVGRTIEIVVSKFEDCSLAGNCFDIAASATAFHWDKAVELLDEVEDLARRAFAGTVTRPYKTVLYTARRGPR